MGSLSANGGLLMAHLQTNEHFATIGRRSVELWKQLPVATSQTFLVMWEGEEGKPWP